MKTLLGIEISDEEFDTFFCEQSKGKEIVLVDGSLSLKERMTDTTQEYELIDTPLLDIAETIIALNERIAKLEGGK